MPRSMSPNNYLFKSLFAIVAIFLLSALQSVNAQVKPDMQKAIVEELNAMRGNPVAYAKYLEDMRADYTKTKTFEGLPALDEAITALKAAKPLGKVDWSDGLFKIADVHATDMSTTGTFSHKGSDGSTPLDRVNRFGSFSGYTGEAITTYSESARIVIIKWLIDDGNQRRGHRKILLEPSVTIAAVSAKQDSKSKFYCVLVAAADYAEKGAAIATPVKTAPTVQKTATTPTTKPASTSDSAKPKPKQATAKPTKMR